MTVIKRWLRHFRTQLMLGVALLILTVTVLQIATFYVILQNLEVDNATRTLDIALKAAWAQFNARPYIVGGVLRQAAHSRQIQLAIQERNPTPLHDVLSDWRISYPYVDFWLVTDAEGTVLSRSGSSTAGERWFFADLAQTAQLAGDTLVTTELMPADALYREGPDAARKAEVVLLTNESEGTAGDEPQKFRDGLVTLVMTPVRNPDGHAVGTLVAGMLLNHNTWIAEEYTKRVPNTYLSIGTQGVRIVSNIETSELSRPLGSLQEKALYETTGRGEKYRGRLVVNGRLSLLAVDPIFNHAGEVVGNIGVGAPIAKFAEYGASSVRWALAACAAVFTIGLVLTSWVARAIVDPIAKLRGLAQAVASQTVNPDAIVWNARRAPVEVSELAETMIEMAVALQRKEQEAYTYAAALAAEKQHLEAKIQERTQELADTVAQLEIANKHKSQFLANMSHELRTPLNAIIGFARLLRDQVAGQLNEKQARYTEMILAGGEHLLSIINDILDLIKIEQGKGNFRPGWVSPGEVVEEVTRLFSQQAEDKGLQLTAQVQPGLPEAYWDAKRVKQVLANLISNAIKFTSSGGRVHVSAAREGEAILFSVADTGIGIKPEDQERVFLAFEQADSSLTRRFQGTGLGLAISKQLVELHSGHIWLESVPGSGTTVYFMLPIRPSRPEERSEAIAGTPNHPDRGG